MQRGGGGWLAGADWKEFGENKGEKTQVDRQRDRRRDGGVAPKLRPIENRVCWKSCCDDVLLRCSRDFRRQTNTNATTEIDLTLGRLRRRRKRYR